jgi:hypothetical protein
VRGLTFGAYLSTRWLPGKRIELEASTYAGYRRNIQNHIEPALRRIRLRRLRDTTSRRFYDQLLHPRDGRTPLSRKTVYEMHLAIVPCGSRRRPRLDRAEVEEIVVGSGPTPAPWPTGQ